MSLSAKYQAFLARPDSSVLAANVALHYITTLTSLHEPAPILKHLSVQEKLLKKTAEKVLTSFESGDNLCLEVDTTIEFISGGGAYLPGLDDNFVADRTVYFPVIHIVHFDENQKIDQVRLHWDQGSLLKQIEVIGARARNWPIRNGIEQARLIVSSSASVTQQQSAASSRRHTNASQGPDDVVISARPSSSASSNAMRDPHATLSLFEPRDVNQESSYAARPTVARAQSAKPPPREYTELFVGEEYEKQSAGATPSPQKRGIPAKSGAGKNFKPSRLFEDPEGESAANPPPSIKAHPKKYDHFEFADPDDEQATPKVRETARPAVRSKHQSQWDFEDFATPNKTAPKVLPGAVRHFGWSDDEDDTSPVRRPIVHKARPDADTHFKFEDEGTPAAAKQAAPIMKGRLHNKGLGLYKDHVTNTTEDDEDDQPNGDVKRALGDVSTVVNNAHRKKDFGSQWEMADESPNAQKNASAKPMPEDRQKVLRGLDAHWGLYEQSPEPSNKTSEKERGINISGNGMGGRKGTGPSWAIGDDDQQVDRPIKPRGGAPIDHGEDAGKENHAINISGNGMGGRKGTAPSWAIGDDDQQVDRPIKPRGGAPIDHGDDAGKENRGINISGNGMGGRKDAGAWSIGEDDSNAPVPVKPRGGAPAARATENKGFWDF